MWFYSIKERLEMADKKLQCDVQKAFSEAKSLRDAVKVAWSSDLNNSPMYQHYTTLPRLLDKIMSKRWYLSRADCPMMNDTHEMTKAFPGCKASRKRTYIMCLSRCTSESVAMWRTYNATEDPFAVRVSLPRGEVHKWMKSVKDEKKIKVDTKTALKDSAIELVNFHDVLYGALQGDEKLDDYDIQRRNVVRWGNAVYKLKSGEDFRKIGKPDCGAWVKDYEWHHERESRLCVRLKEEIKAESLSVGIPDYILKTMRFTFSPWLVDERLEECVRNVIETVLKISLDCKGELQRLPQRYRRSVLQGALNFRR